MADNKKMTQEEEVKFFSFRTETIAERNEIIEAAKKDQRSLASFCRFAALDRARKINAQG